MPRLHLRGRGQDRSLNAEADHAGGDHGDSPPVLDQVASFHDFTDPLELSFMIVPDSGGELAFRRQRKIAKNCLRGFNADGVVTSKAPSEFAGGQQK